MWVITGLKEDIDRAQATLHRHYGGRENDTEQGTPCQPGLPG